MAEASAQTDPSIRIPGTSLNLLADQETPASVQCPQIRPDTIPSSKKVVPGTPVQLGKSQMKYLQSHTLCSKSSRKHGKYEQVLRIHHTKSPSAVQSLSKYCFIPGDGHEEFKQWRQLKKCLRCFSAQHIANDCNIEWEPVSESCRLCLSLTSSVITIPAPDIILIVLILDTKTDFAVLVASKHLLSPSHFPTLLHCQL